jgi:hypothetical protein
MTTLASPTLTKARQRTVDGAEGAESAGRSRLLILGGLSGVAAGLLFFGVQAAIPWDHDLPLELPRWEAVLALSAWVVWLGTRRAGHDVAAPSGRDGHEGRISVASAAERIRTQEE